MPKTKFKRTMIASSRGNYVRHSHLLYLQEELGKRGTKATLQEIIEITVVRKVHYFVSFLGREIEVSREEAAKLSVTFNIIER